MSKRSRLARETGESRRRTTPRWSARQFVGPTDCLGIPPQAKITAGLKAASPAEILEATGKLAQLTARFAQIAPPLLPMLDELASLERFIEAAAEGIVAAGIDLIIGTTREEANSFFCDPSMQNPDPAQVAEYISSLTGQEDSIEQYRRWRLGSRAVDVLSDAVTDYSFLFPSLRLAEAASKTGACIWVYQFDWAPADSPFKACHCLELPFVFGNLQAWSNAPMLQGTNPAVFADLSRAIRSAWIGFVHESNPTAWTPWPQYQVESRQTMRFASVLGPVGDLAGATWRSGLVS